MGNLAIFNFALECKAMEAWKDYKLCDITTAGFNFVHDVQAVLGDQNDDTVITIVCGVDRPKSIYIKTLEKAHAVTWYRGFIVVPCTI